MHSTLTPRETDPHDVDPHDVFVIEPDVVLAARTDQASDDLAHDAMSRPSAPQATMASGASPSSVDTTFRAADVNTIQLPGELPSTSRWVKRAILAFLFAMCSVAAAAWQQYGDAAKQVIASFTPPFVLTSSPPAEKPALTGQPGSPAIQAAAADQTPAQPAAPAQPLRAQPLEGASPDVAASSAESTQMLQSMARDLASMGQQVEELKASIEQLRANRQPMSRDMANNSPANSFPANNSLTKNSSMKNSATRNSPTKNSATQTVQQNLRPRIAAAPLRSAPATARQPRPAFSPAPTAAAPVPPPQPEPQVQPTAQPEAEPVLRPPMPVR